jgi:hypothetical protein
MKIEKIRGLLARLFLSRITVRSAAIPKRTAEIYTCRRTLAVRPLPLLGPPEVLSGFPKERKNGVVVRSGNKGLRSISVKGGAVRLLEGRVPGVHGHLLGRNRLGPPGSIAPLTVSLRRGCDRIAALPQERVSRLSQIKHRPSALRADEIPLALFYPLLQDNLEKSILNREKGTLLLWYNSSSRVSSSRALLLLRRTGGEGGLVWRWISPD